MAPLHNFMLAAFLIISHLAAHINAETFTQTVPDNDLQLNCAFTLGGYAYDLCPLTEHKVVVPVEEDPNEGNDHDQRGWRVKSRFFQLNLGLDVVPRRGGPTVVPEVSRIYSDPSKSLWSRKVGCDKTIWICLTTLIYKNIGETSEYEGISAISTAIAGRIQGETQNKLNVTLDVDEHDASPLRLTLGGSTTRKGITRSAEIAMHCAEAENLRYIKEDRELYSFKWETPHACPTAIPRSLASVSQEQGFDKEQPATPEEPEKGEDDLMPPQGMSKFRKFMIFALVTLLLPSICGFVLFSSSRARNFTTNKFNTALLPFVSRVALKLRPIGSTINSLTSQSIGRLKAPFRQGEGELVRWAQEDMTLADSDNIMVNGSLDEDRWDADGFEEYIPLTMNPTHGRSRRVRSYGSTPDVETFAERQQGLLSTRIGKYFKR